MKSVPAGIKGALAETLFPGRSVLRAGEVAKALRISAQQVIDLIEEGKLMAVNVASGPRSRENPDGNKTSRRAFRIPVSSFDLLVTSSLE